MAKYTADQMIKALEKTRGNKAAASRALGCSRNTLDRYIREYATVAEAYESVNEAGLDVAESLLHRFAEGNIKGQSTREQLDAVKYLLSTKGKHRGYTKKSESEVSGAEGGPIIVDLVPDDDD